MNIVPNGLCEIKVLGYMM